MIDRDDLVDWFEDDAQRGIASNAELADLLDSTEGFVRAQGRRLNVRRVGSAMAWTLDDALELYDALAEEAEADEEDEEDDLDDELEVEDAEEEDDDLDDDEE